jgi:uncharacterized protein
MNDEGLDFEWDAANLEHIATHGITAEEAEQAILGDALEIELQVDEESDAEERLLQLGETATGRILQIVTTWRNGRIRVISAWDAPRQLRIYYLFEMRRLYGEPEDSEI